MPPDEHQLVTQNLIISEVKDLRKALISAVNRFESDINELYGKVDQLKTDLHNSGIDDKTIQELDEWKKDIQKVLTIDDFKGLKDESRNSREFRIKIMAYSAAVSFIVAAIWKLAEQFLPAGIK